MSKPCIEESDNFSWGVLTDDQDNNLKIVVNPINPICHSCENFKDCVSLIVEKGKERHMSKYGNDLGSVNRSIHKVIH